MKFGLIGHPIAHSLSPALFKAGYDGEYPYELIEGENFEASYRRFLDSFDGINVTAPFKEEAFARAEILSEECRLIKATNLLVKTPEGIKAYNSDYLGVRMWLSEMTGGLSRSDWGTPTTLIAGTGGAGKAAAIAAASLGMNIILMNRNRSKAESIAESIARLQHPPYTEIRQLEEFKECFRKSDIIIYNIPTAIPQINDLDDDDFRGCIEKPRKHILEANYKDPSFTEDFIRRMTNANPAATYTNGTVWLLYQALTGYELFTGKKPDLLSMSAVL